MSGHTQHSPVKTSNLPDKCPMTGANLQAWVSVYDKVKNVTCLNSLSFLFCLQVQLNYQYSVSITKQRLLLLILNLAELIDLVRLIIIYCTDAIHVCNYRRVGEVLYIYFRTVRKIVYMAESKCRPIEKMIQTT